MFLNLLLSFTRSDLIKVNVSKINVIEHDKETIDTLVFEESCHFLNFNQSSTFCKDKDCKETFSNDYFQGPVLGTIYLKGQRTIFFAYYNNYYASFDRLSEENCSVLYVSGETKESIHQVQEKTTLYQTYPNQRVFAILNVTSEFFELALNYDMKINQFSIFRFDEIDINTNFLGNSMDFSRFNSILNLTKGAYHLTFFSRLSTSDQRDFLYLRPTKKGSPIPKAGFFNLSKGMIYSPYNISTIYVPTNFTGSIFMEPYQGGKNVEVSSKESDFSNKLKPGDFYRVTGDLLYFEDSEAKVSSSQILTYPVLVEFPNYQGYLIQDQFVFDYTKLANTLIFITSNEPFHFSIVYSGFSGENEENQINNNLVIYQITDTPDVIPEKVFKNSYGTYNNTTSNLIFGVLFNGATTSDVDPNNIIVKFYQNTADLSSYGVPGGGFTNLTLISNVYELEVFSNIMIIAMSFDHDLYRVQYYLNDEYRVESLNRSFPGINAREGAVIRIGKKHDISFNPYFMYQSISIDVERCSQLDIVLSSKPYWFASSTSKDRNSSILEGKSICAWLIPFTKTTFSARGKVSNKSIVKIIDGDKTFNGFNQTVFRDLSGSFNVSTSKQPDEDSDSFYKRSVSETEFLPKDYYLRSTFVIVHPKDILDDSYVYVEAEEETHKDNDINLGTTSLILNSLGALVPGKNIPPKVPSEYPGFPDWAIGIIVAVSVIIIGVGSGFLIWRIRRKKVNEYNDLMDFQY